VINACAQTPRDGQPGTWIVPEMIDAYINLHRAGHAHSVETWVNGELVGGLYCVNLGHMVFGESMFSYQSDASKIALAGLVAFCTAQGIPMIDCQQNTAHLASLGAAEIPRADFVDQIKQNAPKPSPVWIFDTLYWQQFLKPQT
jgi:leucyl/phenylalanyl-tRNA--protein transferase